MFELETRRLRLLPLGRDDLRQLLNDRRGLERTLGLQVTDAATRGPVRGTIETSLRLMQEDEANALWYTHWQIVLKAENRIIGSFGFKGRPNDQGEVEIGYGIEPAYRQRGYMSEAVRTAVDWALCQSGVLAVTAETAKSNGASIRVLQKVGMVQDRETAHYLYWRLAYAGDRWHECRAYVERRE